MVTVRDSVSLTTAAVSEDVQALDPTATQPDEVTDNYQGMPQLVLH